MDKLMGEPLTIWENIKFFLGFPKIVQNGRCAKCGDGSEICNGLIDLGDGDRICRPCWNTHIPGYEEV